MAARHTGGCQFREHVPDERLAMDASVMEIYNKYRDIIAMKPPQLMFPERLTRLVGREPGDDGNGRLQCKEVFWWEGIQLIPPRPPFGLLGKLYTSNTKFNPSARPGSPALGTAQTSAQSLAGNCSSSSAVTLEKEKEPKSPPIKEEIEEVPKTKISWYTKKGAPGGAGDSTGESGGEQSSSSDESEQSSASGRSDEESTSRRPQHRVPRRHVHSHSHPATKRTRVVGRQWITCLSARSNQDGQRRFEERAARQMRAALARNAQIQPQTKSKTPPGGVYARLEAEWRERHCQRSRTSQSARRGTSQPANKYK